MNVNLTKNFIKRINIIDNGLKDSIEVKNSIKKLITKYNLIYDTMNYDLVIAVGGDGTFIKSLKETIFNTEILYVGVHTGHLGFLQEVQVEEIEKLFQNIITNDYKVEKLSIEKIDIITDNKTLEYYALNEGIIRDIDLKTIKMEVKINNKHYETFAGDGKSICTPTGSTAYNLSSGGSIVYPSLKTLQLLPLSPLPMSKYFTCLRNSVIVPENMVITLIPQKEYEKRIKLVIDGESIQLDNEIVKQINITTAKEGISVLRFNRYDFWERINEKFLTF